MAEKKLKSMNDIPAPDALTFLDQFLFRPEELSGPVPKWFKEVGARDFLECLKMYKETMEGWSPLSEETSGEDLDELMKSVQAMPEHEGEAALALLSPKVQETFRILRANPLCSQKELAEKFSPPISVKTLKIYLESLRDRFNVKSTRELHSV